MALPTSSRSLTATGCSRGRAPKRPIGLSRSPIRGECARNPREIRRQGDFAWSNHGQGPFDSRAWQCDPIPQAQFDDVSGNAIASHGPNPASKNIKMAKRSWLEKHSMSPRDQSRHSDRVAGHRRSAPISRHCQSPSACLKGAVGDVTPMRRTECV